MTSDHFRSITNLILVFASHLELVNGRGFNSHSVQIFALLFLYPDVNLVEVWWGLVGLEGEHTQKACIVFFFDVEL